LQVAGVTKAVVVQQTEPANSLVLIVGGSALSEQSKEKVRAHIEARLPAYMRPSRIEISQDIPLSLSGKIDRTKITALYAQR
jgi:acyl-coenzyme A synthetase/AMP-(fatty) acid ligase